MTYKGKGGKQYNLAQNPFAQGGEGKVYEVLGDMQIVAKLYKNGLNTVEKERKLITMVDNPPDKTVMTQISWPLDVLYDSSNTFVGFVMPRLSINEELNVIYEYGSTAKYPNIPWTNKIIIAKNLCAVLDAVHSAGHVVGDLNPKNISVDPSTGHIVFVDTDSYHIEDNGTVYRCNVGMPEYLPVEIQRKMKGGLSAAPLPTFSKDTDNFALAVHIFQLLMNGTHPFACRILPSQASVVFPQPSDNIMNGVFPFMQPKSGIAIPIYAPDIDILPAYIKKLFSRAFIDGHNTPAQRPNAEEWYNALVQLERELVSCKHISHHEYHKSLKKCPWCEVDQRFGAGVVAAKKTPMVQTTIKTSMKPAYQTPKRTNPQPPTTTKYKANRTSSYSTSNSIKVASICVFVVSILAIIIGILLLKAPQLIFENIHWGWILGGGITIFIGSTIWAIIAGVKGSDKQFVVTQFLTGGCVLALMIFGLCFAHTTTYQISSPEDFNLFNNLPHKDKQFYYVEVMNDIDFSGYDVAEKYGNTDINVMLEGNGYTIKNIDYSNTLEGTEFFLQFGSAYLTGSSGLGLSTPGNPNVSSKIKNLSFKNCEFELTPNSYSDYSHEGNECNFYLIGSYSSSSSSVALENVNISATVRINKAEKNIRYNSLSTVGSIYPVNQTENGCNIDITIIREE